MVKYRLTTGATIVARPAYLPPDPKTLGDAGVVFAVSCDGFVVRRARRDRRNVVAVFHGRADRGVARGDRRPRVRHHATRRHVCTRHQDRQESLVGGKRDAVRCRQQDAGVCHRRHRAHLLVLSAASGAKLDSIPTAGISTVLANPDTDRIYLVSNSGLIQCLREAEQTEPFLHNAERKAAAKAGLTPPPKKEVKEEKPKKEHAPPKTPTVPKERKERPKKEPKAPKVKPPRRGGKKGAATTSAIRPIQPGGPQGPAKGRGRLPNNNGNNPS